jgi:hypothetical protein
VLKPSAFTVNCNEKITANNDSRIFVRAFDFIFLKIKVKPN